MDDKKAVADSFDEEKPQDGKGEEETTEAATIEEERDTDEQEPVLTDEEQDEDEEIQDPLERIAELEKNVKTEHDRLLRATADLDNYRKRSRREIEETAIRERATVLREILPVIDSVDLALASAKPDSPAAGIIEGIEMIRKQFLVATERFGLRPLESLGQTFDPNFHEAVAQALSEEHEPGQVMEEVRKGYLLGDRLLRAALVIVAREKTEFESAQSAQSDDSGPSPDSTAPPESAPAEDDGDDRLESENETDSLENRAENDIDNASEPSRNEEVTDE